MTNQIEFNWFSPLGISVTLFLIHGLLWVLIGSLTPFFWGNSPLKPPGLIMSYRTDKALLGDEPEKVIKENKPFHKAMGVAVSMLAGMLVVAGTLTIAIAWFGLRNGQAWGLIVLAITGVIVLPFWWQVFKPYSDVGIKITLADTPPLIWIPALLYLPAIILGWLGLK